MLFGFYGEGDGVLDEKEILFSRKRIEKEKVNEGEMFNQAHAQFRINSS